MGEMGDLPEYCGNLYLVFGFHGILLIDADSHIDAQGQYTGFHSCDVTMIEHCMVPPNPELWGMPWEEPEAPPHVCGHYVEPLGDDFCDVCDAPLRYMDSRVIDPSDPRLPDLDLEADKARVLARADQLSARWRDLEGQEPQT